MPRRDLTARRPLVQNNHIKQVPSKKPPVDVTRNPLFTKKTAPSSLSKKIEPSTNPAALKNNKRTRSPKRVESRVSSPIPPNRISSPTPKLKKSPTHRLNKSPTPTSNRSPTPKANVSVTSPTTRSVSSTKNSQASSRHSTTANTPSSATEQKATMQRSSTFLKEKPTILNNKVT